MRRVLVIGSGGAGKSTVAARISQRLGLPVIHLDALYWQPGWVETPADEWEQIVRQLLPREAWVMDGNYGGTLDLRLAAADAVVFLDTPRLLCLWRVVKRWAQFYGRSRPDMARDCPERLTEDFVRWIWRYPQEQRPRILDKLRAVEQEKRVVVLASTTEVCHFLDRLPSCAA
ncbi:MAG: DNA topology modulation protein [Bacteroidota bacterium]